MKNITLTSFFILYSMFSYAQWTQIGLTFNGDNVEDTFGDTVSINATGDIIAIGAPINDTAGDDYGQVKVLRFENNNWIQMGSSLYGDMSPQAGEKFGWAIDLNDSGLRLVVGSPFFNDGVTLIPGATKVFDYNGTDWVQIGSTIEGENNQDLSGWSVATNSDGSRIITGSVGNSDNGTGSGQARIYEYNGTDWAQIGNDIEGETEHLAGGSGVEINSTGDIVAVGFTENNDPANPPGKGIVRVFELIGSVWQQIGNDLLGDVEGGGSGSEVSLNTLGNRIALGARFHSGAEPFSGQVKVFELQSGSWVQVGSDLEGEMAEALGTSVDLNADGTILAAGGRANNPIDLQRGIVRVFKYINNDWEQYDDPIYGVADEDKSGRSVGINGLGNIVVMGAPFNDDNGSNSGHARAFKNDAILSISENLLENSLVLSPNPNGGSFTLNFTESFQNVNILISDATGKIVFSEEFITSEGITINQNLSAGLYMVNVRTDTSEAIIKMLVD